MGDVTGRVALLGPPLWRRRDAGFAGSQTAQAGWTRALLTADGPAGIDFFVPGDWIDRSRRWLRDCEATGGIQTEARVFPVWHLPARLRTGEYAVLHDVRNADRFGWLCDLRTACGASGTAVTAVDYAVGSAASIRACVATALSSASRSKDAIICLSEAAAGARRACLSHAGAVLAARFPGLRPAMPALPVIPFGVDTEWFRPGSRSAARRRVGLVGRGQVLLHVARFAPDKADWAALFRLLRQVLEAAHPVHLVLAGGSSREDLLGLDRLRRLFGCARHCSLRPNVDAELLPDYYRAADVVLAFSHSPYETEGLSILEAMACGVPVVASDWSGFRELVRDGETGFLAPTAVRAGPSDLDWEGYLDVGGDRSWERSCADSVAVDVGAAAAGVRRLLADAALAMRMGGCGRERATGAYGVERTRAAYVEAWTELAAAAAPRKAEGDVLWPPFGALFSGFGTRPVTSEARAPRWLDGPAAPSVGLRELAAVTRTPVPLDRLSRVAAGLQEQSVGAPSGRADWDLHSILWLAKHGWCVFPGRGQGQHRESWGAPTGPEA